MAQMERMRALQRKSVWQPSDVLFLHVRISVRIGLMARLADQYVPPLSCEVQAELLGRGDMGGALRRLRAKNA